MAPRKAVRPDIVFRVRAGRLNDELRYALRSVVNLPHRNVFLFGDCPAFVDRATVTFVPVAQDGDKHANTTAALAAACADERVSANFVLWDDDCYLMRPLTGLPVYHRGPLAEQLGAYERQGIGGSEYAGGARRTLELLRTLGFDEPLSYDVHAPMTVNKPLMAAALEHCGGEFLFKRTVYGNLAHCAGERIEDPKHVGSPSKRFDPGALWVSTNDFSWRTVDAGHAVRHAFLQRGPHELTAQVEAQARKDELRALRMRPYPGVGK